VEVRPRRVEQGAGARRRRRRHVTAAGLRAVPASNLRLGVCSSDEIDLNIQYRKCRLRPKWLCLGPGYSDDTRVPRARPPRRRRGAPSSAPRLPRSRFCLSTTRRRYVGPRVAATSSVAAPPRPRSRRRRRRRRPPRAICGRVARPRRRSRATSSR
jgi:hypothetical protein